MKDSHPSYILYLDIDGVLRPYSKEGDTQYRGSQELDKMCLARLDNFLYKNTDIAVCLCSTWRKLPDDIIALFEQWPNLFGYRLPIGFVTPIFSSIQFNRLSPHIQKELENLDNMDMKGKDRGLEIDQHWNSIKNVFPDIRNYIILEDEECSLFECQRSHNVKPDMYLGIQDTDIVKLENLLTKLEKGN